MARLPHGGRPRDLRDLHAHQFLLNDRYGAHYLGIEYSCESVADARAAVAERGMRISRDIGVAIHTNPADSFGMSFEFWEGTFHDNDWPLLGGGKMKSESYWRDEHPLGLTGLESYSVAVADIDAASSFFQDFVDAKPVYEEFRPEVAARVIGLQVADAVVELMTPTGEGTLQRHLYRYGDGIRSTVFGARDIEAVRCYFADKAVNLVPGDAPERLALPAGKNRGLIFEFAE
jgi:hypothetical protein